MARSALALLATLVASADALAQSGADTALKQAGVCSRCHVAQVLEWSASKHVRAGTACQNCHGPSVAHVANERNEVKPDRLPRDAAIAGLCAQCHGGGCPKTKRADACQSCHHQHALIDPNAKATPSVDPPATVEYRRRMDAGEALVKQAKWREARAEFDAALRARPGDREARDRSAYCARRLDPSIPGFAPMGQATDPATGLPASVRVDLLGSEMLLVGGGEFDMGSDARPGSAPSHTVRVRPFYLARRELTQREWALMGGGIGGDDPSTRKGPDLPVHGVSWRDATAWIDRLNARVPGAGFRLPTEAEWEFVARGAASGPLEGRAWFRANARVVEPTAGGFSEIDAYAPRPVGTRTANAAGFFDLFGNVAEWCSSVRAPYPYSAVDGREAADSPGQRIIRGGGYASSAAELDPVLRHAGRPDQRVPWNGIRLARSVPR